jgi:pimeloyl-ACP methyl ester carboxylesterase
MNKLPNYSTPISVDGFGTLDIHFVYQKSGVKNAIPLLFCHGWPGSFMEVTKMLPLLKGGDGRPAFDIVAPSLPNYCWSEGVKKVGISNSFCAFGGGPELGHASV